MIGLHRDLSPLSEKAWKEVDQQAAEILKLHLAARRLMDFEGPRGWDYSALDLGDVESLEGNASGAQVRRRVVRPLIELRVPFQLERHQVERIDRGAASADLEPLCQAARDFASAEDTILFAGYEAAGIRGLVSSAGNEGVALPKESAGFPDAFSEALEELRQAGVGGPYAAALGPDPYRELHGTSGGRGYPVLRHVQRLIDGPIVWAPSLRGGVVVSLRGGDFKLVCGRDAAIGYLGHDAERVQLYLEESLSAELSGPEAAVPLFPA
jgi:uncharacterized linocin/CFP29 family protein